MRKADAIALRSKERDFSFYPIKRIVWLFGLLGVFASMAFT